MKVSKDKTIELEAGSAALVVRMVGANLEMEAYISADHTAPGAVETAQTVLIASAALGDEGILEAATKHLISKVDDMLGSRAAN